MTDILAVLKQFCTEFNPYLQSCFPLPQGAEKRVVEAMSYSVMNGGKRLRAFLVCNTADLFGVPTKVSFPVAASLEMLHAYSLVHDDLPAMDNDDLRRGKPTCHKQFDEATAILAGDGLQTYAFEYLANSLEIRPEIRLTLLQLLASAGGAFGGMVAGQTLDLYATSAGNQKEDEDIIARLEEMKTGRLLRYAVESGAVLGQAPLDVRQKLVSYSRKIGQAFQIADDILDREGDPKLVGKTLHKDDAQHKFTYVSYYGVEQARKFARKLITEAIGELEVFGNKADNLRALAQYIINRNY
ncbi:MAG: polyprenyl synthetase family protein [Alphaproteobacteria bacterium]|nr:polyprenyl synthetase family protein [Alphaproteobacteria bacterium]